MLSIAVEAYDAITGREGPEDELAPWPRRDPGPDWDLSDPAELQRRYPRLWACLGHDAQTTAAQPSSHRRSSQHAVKCRFDGGEFPIAARIRPPAATGSRGTCPRPLLSRR
jgi:hypothetical protein